MPPEIWLPWWQDLGPVLAGLGAIVTAWYTGVRVRGEILDMRSENAKTARETSAILHEQRPNSGGSLRDAVDSVVSKLDTLSAAVEDLTIATMRQDRELHQQRELILEAGRRATMDGHHVAERLDDISGRVSELEKEE
jgi:hypothetical protein